MRKRLERKIPPAQWQNRYSEMTCLDPFRSQTLRSGLKIQDYPAACQALLRCCPDLLPPPALTLILRNLRPIICGIFGGVPNKVPALGTIHQVGGDSIKGLQLQLQLGIRISDNRLNNIDSLGSFGDTAST